MTPEKYEWELNKLKEQVESLKEDQDKLLETQREFQNAKIWGQAVIWTTIGLIAFIMKGQPYLDKFKRIFE